MGSSRTNRTLMGKAEYALHRDVAPAVISQWLKEKKLVLYNGKIDSDATDAVLASVLSTTVGGDMTRGGTGGSNPLHSVPKKAKAKTAAKVSKGDKRGVVDHKNNNKNNQDEGDPDADDEQVEALLDQAANYSQLRTERERIAVARERAAYELQIGKQCMTDRVVKVITSNITATQQLLERLPDRLASRVAAEPDERKCRAMMQQEIRDVMREIANIGESMPDLLTKTEQ